MDNVDKLKGVDGIKSVTKLSSRWDNRGGIYEIKVGAHIFDRKIKQMGKDIKTSAGNTDIDTLLEDGTIIEAKSGQSWSRVKKEGIKNYKDLNDKLERFKAYHTDNNINAGIEVFFEVEPSAEIKELLNQYGAIPRRLT